MKRQGREDNRKSRGTPAAHADCMSGARIGRHARSGKVVARTRLSRHQIKATPVHQPTGSHAKSSADPGHWATWGAARDGAHTVLTMRQKCTLVPLMVAGLILLALRPTAALIALLTVVNALYIALIALLTVVNALYMVTAI